MMSPQQRRSLTLSPGEWRALEELARTTNSNATAGPSTGDQSWRALIRRIAQSELTVTEKADVRKS